MRYIRSPEAPPELYDFAHKVVLTTKRRPDIPFAVDESLPLHAARLLLLISLAGRPLREPRIEGRTKLAKLDFFVRYPQFLEKAARILSAKGQVQQIKSILEKGATVESHMIRYRYGPWDQRYYLVLAYLSGKSLINVRPKEGVDQYLLTESGHTIAATLQALPEFEHIVIECQIVGELFGDRKGGWVKDFIYRYFPEVVHTPYNQIISKVVENA